MLWVLHFSDKKTVVNVQSSCFLSNILLPHQSNNVNGAVFPVCLEDGLKPVSKLRTKCAQPTGGGGEWEGERGAGIFRVLRCKGRIQIQGEQHRAGYTRYPQAANQDVALADKSIQLVDALNVQIRGFFGSEDLLPNKSSHWEGKIILLCHFADDSDDMHGQLPVVANERTLGHQKPRRINAEGCHFQLSKQLSTVGVMQNNLCHVLLFMLVLYNSGIGPAVQVPSDVLGDEEAEAAEEHCWTVAWNLVTP